MNWALFGLLTALTAAAETPVETALSLNTQGNRLAESGNCSEAQRLSWFTEPVTYASPRIHFLFLLSTAYLNFWQWVGLVF